MSAKQTTDPPTIGRPPKTKTSKLLSSSKMESPFAVEQRFRSNDMELLETGLYSDAQVSLFGRVWNVHKSIVCQRSGYMRDAFSKQSNDQTSEPVTLPFGTTDAKAEMLLEFIYSGGIMDISSRTMADCVDLALIGRKLQVVGMISYATDNLWKKLKAYLQETLTLPAGSKTYQQGFVPKASVDGAVFKVSFSQAVLTAYGINRFDKIPLNPCQPILADFVWLARTRLLGTPFIEDLNRVFPRFGSHVLTTLNKGPQSSFIKSDGQVTSTFCTKCAQDEPDGSGGSFQVALWDSR